MYGFIKIFGIVLFLAVVVGLLSPNKDLPASSITSSSTTSPAPAPPAPAPPPPPAPKPGTQWKYLQDADEMSNGVLYSAYVNSTNTVDFDFPYSGPQVASLILRTHPRSGKRILLYIERGQFLCSSYQDCTVLVRFDDQNPQKFTAVGPADGSARMLFIRDYSRFVSSMLKAKRVRMSAKIYQEGSPVFDFDVTGFDASKYKPK